MCGKGSRDTEVEGTIVVGEVEWSNNEEKDEVGLSMERGRCNLGRQGFGMGKKLFVSSLQVSKKGVDGVLKEKRQLVGICCEENGEQHFIIVGIQRPMGKGDLSNYSK